MENQKQRLHNSTKVKVTLKSKETGSKEKNVLEVESNIQKNIFSKNELSECLKDIFEIELFKDNYEALRKKTLKPPVKRKSTAKPSYPKTQMKNINPPVKNEIEFKSILIKIIIGIFLIWLCIGEKTSLVILPLGGLVILIGSVVVPMYEEDQRYQQALTKYQKDIEAEKKRCREEDAKEKEKIDKEYNKIVKENNEKFKAEREEYELALKEIDDLKETFHRAVEKLNDLYTKTGIPEKYRNLPAISTFYDFISTGICESLDGKDGAFNLYEEQLQKEKSEQEIERLESLIAKLQKDLENERELNYSRMQHESFMRSMDDFELRMAIREGIHDLNMNIDNYL